jgi:hypothetical protein
VSLLLSTVIVDPISPAHISAASFSFPILFIMSAFRSSTRLFHRVQRTYATQPQTSAGLSRAFKMLLVCHALADFL